MMKTNLEYVISKELAEIINWKGPIEYVWDGTRLVAEDLYVELPKHVIPAPPLHLVLSYLRKEKGVVIDARPIPVCDGEPKWISDRWDIGEKGKVRYVSYAISTTWEGACEKLIEEYYEGSKN